MGSWEGEGGCGVGQEETERRMEREVERENIHHENHLRHESSPLPVQMVPVGSYEKTCGKENMAEIHMPA